MLRYIKSFFSPSVLIYRYDLPEQEVVDKISEIISEKITIVGRSDIRGAFLTNDTFFMGTYSSSNLDSTLVGKINELKKESTEIKIKAKPSFVLYIIFFVTVVSGLINFIRFLQEGATALLFLSLAILIIGPIFSICLSVIGNRIIEKKYKTYIDEELVKFQHQF